VPVPSELPDPSFPDATVLAVDDSPENLRVLSDMLQPAYRVLAATSGERALRIVRGEARPDLILLDVMMPGLDGYQVFEALRGDAATRDIPVIFITALTGKEAELRGLELGAVDYITKPIVPPLLLARVRNQLELKRARDRLADQNAWLEAEVARRMVENDLSQLVGIRALAHLAEARDPQTGVHILRTQGYVRELALFLRHRPRFREVLDVRYIDLLTRSAPLHDIGKVGIPDHILCKPGPLTAEEWAVMRTHARIGAEAIELAEQDAEAPVAFLALAKEITRWHHERWDGTGYPDGLAGEDIPVSARIMAVADVLDALISPRVYKAPLGLDAALAIIDQERGRHFDPEVCDVLVDHRPAFEGIVRRYGESARTRLALELRRGDAGSPPGPRFGP
jgi:putative two-component system response regulator